MNQSSDNNSLTITRSKSVKSAAAKKSVKRSLDKSRSRSRSRSQTLTKRKRLPPIETVSLGKIPASYTSDTNKPVSDADLDKFVRNEIKKGPQIVSIPIYPQRHAFLVDIQSDKIMVSDWGGAKNKIRGIPMINGKKNKIYDKDWKQYSELFLKLESIHGLPVVFYDVDPEIYKIANDSYIKCNGGGCSHYIYAWVKKHYPQYR